jgi:putative membrane protein
MLAKAGLRVLGAGIAFMSGALYLSTARADPPEHFVKEAIQGNIAEVKMGELAQKNGGSDAVKSFGRMLVSDHGKAREQTESLAKSLHVDAPKQPEPDAQAAYEKMAKLKGAEFDREFAHHMVEDHQKDIAKYTEEANEKASPAVAKYAADTLPTLKKHLATAQSLHQ